MESLKSASTTPFQTRVFHPHPLLNPHHPNPSPIPEKPDEENSAGSGLSLLHGIRVRDEPCPTTKLAVVPQRRQRGRPAGSKNRPKPPIVITRDNPNLLRSHVLEFSPGSDIADGLASYSGRRQRGICVLSATGAVADVTLGAMGDSNSVVSLPGRFEILSMSGSFLPPPAPPGATCLSVYLAGVQGQVVGGSVVGALFAARSVVLVVASFGNAAYERLPLEEEKEDAPKQEKEKGDASQQLRQQQQEVMGPLEPVQHPMTVVQSRGLFHHGLTSNLLNGVQLQAEAYGFHPPF